MVIGMSQTSVNGTYKAVTGCINSDKLVSEPISEVALTLYMTRYIGESWFTATAYYIKSKTYGYFLAQINTTIFWDILHNKTHIAVLVGLSISPIFYKTEYGKYLLTSINLGVSSRYNSSPDPLDVGVYTKRLGDNLVYIKYLIYNSTRNITVEFNNTLELISVNTPENKEININSRIEYLVNIIFQETVICSLRVKPNIFMRPIIIQVEYPLNLDLADIIVLYRYRISIITIIMLILVILYEHRLYEFGLISNKSQRESEMEHTR